MAEGIYTELNLAALLRHDTTTVSVLVDKGGGRLATFTYVSHLALEIGDSVIVAVLDDMQIGRVCCIDSEIQIPPGSPTVYRWVIGKIDMGSHEANEARNRDIVEAAAGLMDHGLRRSFAHAVLGQATDKQRELLKALTGETPTH